MHYFKMKKKSKILSPGHTRPLGALTTHCIFDKSNTGRIMFYHDNDIQETHQEMRYSERKLSLQRGKTTVFDRHEIRLRVRVSSLAIRFGSLSYDDIVKAVQNTIDLCINSATDHLARTPNPYPNPSLVLGGVCRSATAALLMYVSLSK